MRTTTLDPFSTSPIFAALLAILVPLLTLDPPPAGAQVPDEFNPGANNWVTSLAVQADGRILVDGFFTTLGGQSRSHLGRLNADGTLDSGFDPSANSDVNSLAVQADRKILVGGLFATLGGQPCNYLGRLNADGTVDIGFNPPRPEGWYRYTCVIALAVQADGKILVGGDFTTLAGQPRSFLARLNGDGTLDNGFNPGADYPVVSLAVQADGKILVGGDFTTLGGQSRTCLGRLNADGTVDNGFNPAPDNTVYALAVQADGRILVGGSFSTLAGQTCKFFGRLNADGTLDSGFNPGADRQVYSVAVQADGKIVVGGVFFTLGGQPRDRVGRLNADGTLDSTFNPGGPVEPNKWVCMVVVQADGNILVSGGFNTLGGQPRSHIGRLNNTSPASQSLSCDNSTITWLRGGTSPEVWRATFDFSTNGNDWTPLGEGSRIPGGWQLTNVSLPTGGTLRAHGFVGGSGLGEGIVETMLPTAPPTPLVILTGDGAFGVISNRFGFHLSGVTGQVVIVEASADLKDWTPLATNSLGATPVYYSEPCSGQFSKRFFRLRLGP
jgi:uncharacterized delta-60 repeat protein